MKIIPKTHSDATGGGNAKATVSQLRTASELHSDFAKCRATVGLRNDGI